ncbi:LysE family translocator [Frigidibacter sp. ROC022]|uniref:LysE family translocator n=1 Tax=Frigidibacter sp. ROC022 TaxID=2971796 RepID=UPI00215AC339|nr:LysE family translocator [Frigidibacter sp. ROC022]MCR8725948.1 LysE family translocator [Frigidibacter sp. ROC022]
MTDPAGLWLFILTSVVIELTPGPNMAWLAVVAASKGRRPGLAAVAGVALGLLVVGLAAALGLAAMIQASPALYQTLRWGGTLWLLYLAWDGWRDADAENTQTEGWPMARYFRRGLVTNLLNPKAAVFFVAVLPGFVDPTGPVVQETVTLSLIFVAVATSIHASIVMLAAAARVLLTDPMRERLLRRGLSLLLAGIAVWFAWTTKG